MLQSGRYLSSLHLSDAHSFSYATSSRINIPEARKTPTVLLAKCELIAFFLVESLKDQLAGQRRKNQAGIKASRSAGCATDIPKAANPDAWLDTHPAPTGGLLVLPSTLRTWNLPEGRRAGVGGALEPEPWGAPCPPRCFLSVSRAFPNFAS